MFENPRTGRQARIFTTNLPKILDLTLGAPENMADPWALVFSCPNESCEFQSINVDDFIARSCTTAAENYYL